MSRKACRVTEVDVSIGTLLVAASRPDGIATFHRLRKELPKYLKLSAGDRVQSITRPNEELWQQLIRNIKSHSNVPGNFIYEGYVIHVPRVGYRITDNGRRYLTRKGH